MALAHMLTSADDHVPCREDPDRMFVQGRSQHWAKQICVPCPVRSACLAEALDARIEFGIWGGMTERERRKLLRQHPEVTDWAGLFKQARAAHERSDQSPPPRALPTHAA